MRVGREHIVPFVPGAELIREWRLADLQTFVPERTAALVVSSLVLSYSSSGHHRLICQTICWRWTPRTVLTRSSSRVAQTKLARILFLKAFDAKGHDSFCLSQTPGAVRRMPSDLSAEFAELPLLTFIEEVVSSQAAAARRIRSSLCPTPTKSSGSLLAALARAGVRNEDLYVVGKSNSTNSGVLSRLSEAESTSCLPDIADGQTSPTTTWFARVDRAMAHLVLENSRSGYRGILVVDDGGHAIRTAKTLALDIDVAAVEQTTRGIRSVTARYLRRSLS